MQTQNRYETLQEDKEISNTDQQPDLVKEKLQADQQSDQNKENQRKETEVTPKKQQEITKDNSEPLFQRQQEAVKKDSGTMELVSEDMEIVDLDLDGLEVACSDKHPT